MINFFTDVYKDELIYSAIARQSYYSGDIALKDVQKTLFQKNSLIPTIGIGSHLEILVEQLGRNYTAKSLIWNNTIYPYYHNFLPSQRQVEIQQSIKYDGGSKIYLLLGHIAGAVCKKHTIYYCSECVEEDIEKQGECYIHREHQLEGVLVCPHHGRALSRYCRDSCNTSRVEYIRLNPKLLHTGDEIQIEGKLLSVLIKLSKMAYELLNIEEGGLYKEKLEMKYRENLRQKDLLTVSGQVRQRELYNAFKLFYSPQLLQLLQSEIDVDNEYNWLKVLTRNSRRVVHPIRHLLLIHFLGIDIRKLLEENKIYQPFGEGPWPCLNKAADHYLEDVVKDINITTDYKTRVPVGTFSCSCGFIYSRKGPDKSECSRYRIGRKKAFGQKWEDKLHRYLQKESIGLRELARKMDCDPKIIQKYDQLFKTYRYTTKEGTTVEADVTNKIVEEDVNQLSMEEQYKNELIEMIRQYPESSRTQIRKQMPKQYIALYRINKQVLEEILPPVRLSKGGKERVDWEARDDAILQQMKEVYEELQQRKPIIRITLGNLSKPVGLENKLPKWVEKLPKTKAFVEDVVETVEAFQIRRCKVIIEEAEEKGEDIKTWQVQRRAGIRTKKFREIFKSLNIELHEGIVVETNI